MFQLMPVTPSAEYRDTVSWVKEMLPDFNNSCAVDPGGCSLMLDCVRFEF